MQVSLTNLLIIAGALLVVLVITVAGLSFARKRKDERLRRHGAPVLVMPINDPVVPPRPRGSQEVFPSRPSPSTVRQVTPAESFEESLDEQFADVIFIQESAGPSRTTPPSRNAEQLDGLAPDERDQLSRTAPADRRSEDGTLEFLPGRLEVVGGGDVGQEIHFVRPEGEDAAVVTFGRSEGPPLRHVQLNDATVSRHHARMVYAGLRWHLFNLSETNPVTLNGTPLPTKARAVSLQEGDRIEMGAVVFVFRER